MLHDSRNGRLLGVAALYILPANAVSRDAIEPKGPALRVALICAGIALLSLASVSLAPATKSACICRCNRGICSDAADRSHGGPCNPAERYLLSTVADWCGTVDGVAAIRCLQPACDLRAAVVAAIARSQSAGRGIYGC